MENGSIDNETKNENSNKRKYIIYLLLFVILLFFCVFGITYSIYKPDNDDQEINTGNIVFTYSDVGKAGNGIAIKNAVPITDELGKVMMGSNQYFDFSITATTNKASLQYKVLVAKDDISTLDNKKVRIYLTQMLGSYENELVLTDFSNLKVETIKDKKYYVLYEKKLDKELEKYSDAFRLRMWVKEDAIDYNDQIFALKVDVYAYQVEG